MNDTQTNTTTANSDEGVEGLSDSFNSVLLVLRLASHLHVMIESLLSLPLDVRVLSVLDEMPFDVVELVVHIASVGKMISDVVSSVLPVFKVLNLIEVLFHFPGVEEVLESLLDVPVRHELLNSVGVFSDEINETLLTQLGLANIITSRRRSAQLLRQQLPWAGGQPGGHRCRS